MGARGLLGLQTVWEASSKFCADFFMILCSKTENPGDLEHPSLADRCEYWMKS